MASDYGLNFGFRRSDESMAVREGRHKTPVGVELRQGTAVEIDPANPGFMKQSAANPTPLTGYHGLLVQEDAHLFSIHEPQWRDTYQLGRTKPNKLSVIWSGAGTKVWFRNTAAETRYDGADYDAVDMFNATGVDVGDGLGWDGTQWVATDATTTNAWLTVTLVNASAGYVEAVLNF